MGSVHKTLFLLRCCTDFLLVQVYVDDIIFGGSSHSLVSSFSDDMSRVFEMLMMGELQFFLGLHQANSGWHLRPPGQVHQGHAQEVRLRGPQSHVDSYGHFYGAG